MPVLTHWPDGAPITSVIVVEDHACDRFRQRSFVDPADHDLSDDEIKDYLIDGIQSNICSFMRPLPGESIWLLQFDGYYMAAARYSDGSMHVVSYYGTKKQLRWHKKVEITVRGKRKVIEPI